jgi:hypothetical protein
VLFIRERKLSRIIYAIIATFAFGGLCANDSSFSRGTGFWTTPADEDATGFFQKLVPKDSQCEDWYRVMPYVAEFWCCVSNIGLIGVGAYFGSPELMIAGAASTVSHAIPKKWLLNIDKIAAIVAASKVIRTYPVLFNNPWLLVPITGVVGIGLVDKFYGREKGNCIPHVAWHCAAAIAGGMYLSCCPK